MNHHEQPTELASDSPATTHTRRQLTPTQRLLVQIVISGVVIIATIGFIGSYAAVSDLAHRKGFGWFAYAFPAGLDASILVFLALDLLLTWLRMPYLVLRPTAWFLTASTIAFNAATAWGDEIAVGMHAVLPILFIASIEAARHAIGQTARVEAGMHYDNPPRIRWIISPWPTYRIWRRMRMWHMRSYTKVIEMERDTKVLRATLRARYGWRWRWFADKRELLALRLARLGTPVGETLAGRYEVTLPARATASRRAATASAAPAAIPAAASPAPATATPAASPGAATPAPASASAESVYVPAAATASEPTAAANAKPATASAAQPAASKPAASGEQRDLDEVADAFRALRNELGRSPSDQALADRLGVGRSRAQQLRTAAIKAGHTDLEKPLRAAS